MHVLGMFYNIVVFVVVRTYLVLWILMALVIGMLAVDAMQVARLIVELTLLRRGLAITGRVLIAGAMSFKAVTIAVSSRPAIVSRPVIALAMPRTAVVALSAF